MRRAARTVAGPVLLALLSGCAGPDPYDFLHTWRPTGANDANLAAMAVRPADLARGRGTAPSDGQFVAAAVDRLRQDRVKRIGDTNGGNGGGGGQPGATGATGPTGN